MQRLVHWVLTFIFIGAVTVPQTSRAAGETFLYLPLVSRNYNPLAGQRIVNAPRVDNLLTFSPCPNSTTPNWCITQLPQMAIFWFGRVSQSENYTDMRVAYTASELVIYAATIDRRLWYDTSPETVDLTAWDSISLYLDLDGVGSGRPTLNTYRFDAQLTNGGELTSASTDSYRGNGTTFVAQNLSYIASAGWRGGTINNDGDDKGWVMTFRIPFASLGVSAPAQGAAMWGLSVVTHDRDSQAGPAEPDKTWPETADALTPSSWGRLAWGLQTYTPPPSTGSNFVTIKHKLNGVTVKDANVGGHTVCGGGFDYWTQWGNVNDKDYNGGSPNPIANIQNQSDISDYPCFAKYYLSFPLGTVPANKVIKNATLTLYQTGGSMGNVTARIQALSFAEDFTDTTLTWNNAPLALRNYSQEPVQAQAGCGSTIPWPCTPRIWNVTQLVVEAYQQGKPARIVLYSADSDYHTGKHFTTSDTGDWNDAGRPKLTVEWGNP